MRYLSVCSGIEAATVAWDPLGFEPVAFSEVEPFPSAVLAQHYPDVPNLGDMTQIDGSKYNGSVDLLVGGTPCQSFSVAGLRGGMADPRGNLALAFLGLVDTIRPKYFVWENVPGVLSSSGGRDFGSFVSAVAQLGYRGGWRVLDAQYFGLAQRRKRVFFVGCSPAAERGPREILFERESLCGDSPPSREAGQGAAGGVTHSLRGEGFDASEDGTGRGVPLIPGTRGGAPVAHALNGKGAAGRFDAESETLIPTVLKIRAGCEGGGKGPLVGEDQSFTLATGGDQTLFAPLPFDTTQVTSPDNYSSPKEGDPVHPLAAGAHPPAVAFDARQDPVVTGEQAPTLGTRDTGHGVAVDVYNGAVDGEVAATLGAASGQANTAGPKVLSECARSVALRTREGELSAELGEPEVANALRGPNGGRAGEGAGAVISRYTVRRLTPRECERLQGFPDDYTRIPWKGKAPEDCPDGPRYKALGNSMAVPVMRWIGSRIGD